MNTKKTQLRLTNADVRSLKAGLLKAGTGERKSPDTPSTLALLYLEELMVAATYMGS